MIKRSFLLAATVAALSFAGNSAQAAFTFSTVISNVSYDSVSTATNTFTFNGVTVTLTDQPTTTATGTVGIPNEQVTVAGTLTSPFNFTVTETIRVNGVNAFTETTTYTVSNGVYTANTPTLATLSTAPAGFTISTPRATDGTINATVNNASISAQITQNAVPEPASIAMVGLGLASVGGLALRRRSAK